MQSVRAVEQRNLRFNSGLEVRRGFEEEGVSEGVRYLPGAGFRVRYSGSSSVQRERCTFTVLEVGDMVIGVRVNGV